MKHRNFQRGFSLFGALISFVAAVVTTVAVGVAAAAAAPAIIAGGVVAVGTALVVCEFNIANACPPSSGSGSGKTSGSSNNSTTVTTAQNNTNANSNNSGNSSGNSPVGAICTSAANAACGITAQGIMVNGVCNATTPPNSACPAPSIDANSGFYAQPSLVKSGQQTTLYWNATNVTGCTLTGDTLGTLAGLLGSGNHLSGSVTQKTTYSLTCINGTGGPSKTVTATVNLVPEFQNK